MCWLILGKASSLVNALLLSRVLVYLDIRCCIVVLFNVVVLVTVRLCFFVLYFCDFRGYYKRPADLYSHVAVPVTYKI